MEIRGKKPQSRYVIMEALADRYHWNWKDIKKIPKSEMDILLKIVGTKDKLYEAEIKTKR